MHQPYGRTTHLYWGTSRGNALCPSRSLSLSRSSRLRFCLWATGSEAVGVPDVLVAPGFREEGKGVHDSLWFVHQNNWKYVLPNSQMRGSIALRSQPLRLQGTVILYLHRAPTDHSSFVPSLRAPWLRVVRRYTGLRNRLTITAACTADL